MDWLVTCHDPDLKRNKSNLGFSGWMKPILGPWSIRPSNKLPNVASCHSIVCHPTSRLTLNIEFNRLKKSNSIKYFWCFNLHRVVAAELLGFSLLVGLRLFRKSQSIPIQMTRRFEFQRSTQLPLSQSHIQIRRTDFFHWTNSTKAASFRTVNKKKRTNCKTFLVFSL